jgi:methanogenic corrinoid protein MtbC1
MRSENLSICQAITAHRDAMAEWIVTRQCAAPLDGTRGCGESNREKSLTEAKRHLDVLSQTIAAGRSALFVDYVAWSKVSLCSRHTPVEDLATSLELCHEALGRLSVDDTSVAQQYVLDGLSCLPSLPEVTPTFVSAERPLASLARAYLDALLNLNRHEASRLVLGAVRQGASIRDIYLHVFQRSQYEVGRLWQSNQISVGQEHLCTAVTQLIMSQLYPLVFGSERKNLRIVAAGVGGELHEIGLRMVADFFEMDGWDTFYLGSDVPTPSIVQAVCERKAHILAISVTLLPHLSKVSEIIEAVKADPRCGDIRILVGGYPFNVAPDLWRDIGADGYAADALRTVDLANQLVQTEAIS